MSNFDDQMEWLQRHAQSGPSCAVCHWAWNEIKRLLKALDATTAERDALAAEIANLRTDAEYNAKFFDEYCAGEEAYTEGRKLTENPHESGTMPHEAWESGWCSSDWFRLTTENDRLRRRWNHVAGLAQTMGVKMDGQNSWRFQPLYHGRGPTIEAAVDDAIEKTQTEPCPDCDGHGQRWSGEGTAVTGGICRTCCGRGAVPQKARDA